MLLYYVTHISCGVPFFITTFYVESQLTGLGCIIRSCLNIIHKITKNFKLVVKQTLKNFWIKYINTFIFLSLTMLVNTHFNFFDC